MGKIMLNGVSYTGAGGGGGSGEYAKKPQVLFDGLSGEQVEGYLRLNDAYIIDLTQGIGKIKGDYGQVRLWTVRVTAIKLETTAIEYFKLHKVDFLMGDNALRPEYSAINTKEEQGITCSISLSEAGGAFIKVKGETGTYIAKVEVL